jgi:hypothetical protein
MKISLLFTFSWVNPLMKRGYNSLIIDVNDLCSLSSIHQHHHQLSRSLLKTFGRPFLLLGILKILGNGLTFGGPIFLNILIIYMQESSGNEQQNRDLLSITLIGTLTVVSFLNTHFTYRLNRLEVRCKMYLYTRIY